MGTEESDRKLYEALQARFAPELTWKDGNADFLDWELRTGTGGGGYWFSVMLDGSFGIDGETATAEEARKAAEDALRRFGVVFRVVG